MIEHRRAGVAFVSILVFVLVLVGFVLPVPAATAKGGPSDNSFAYDGATGLADGGTHTEPGAGQNSPMVTIEPDSDQAPHLGQLADLVAPTSALDDIVRSADDILTPGGTRIGTAGSRGSIREVSGGLDNAQALFTDLSRGGTVVADSTYPGTLIRLPDGGTVGLRTTMTNSPGTIANIDVNIPGIDITKIKFN